MAALSGLIMAAIMASGRVSGPAWAGWLAIPFLSGGFLLYALWTSRFRLALEMNGVEIRRLLRTQFVQWIDIEEAQIVETGVGRLAVWTDAVELKTMKGTVAIPLRIFKKADRTAILKVLRARLKERGIEL